MIVEFKWFIHLRSLFWVCSIS